MPTKGKLRMTFLVNLNTGELQHWGNILGNEKSDMLLVNIKVLMVYVMPQKIYQIELPYK